MWFWGTHMGNWWWLGIIFYLFFLVGLIVLIIFVIKLLSSSEKREQNLPREEPLEVLKRRYAGGEITKEQLEQMKKDLKS